MIDTETFWNLSRRISRTLGGFVAGLVLTLGPPSAHAAVEAEIISVIGKGDKRDTAQAEWMPAFAMQKLNPGAFVRTRDLSQMAILFPDRTQLRLNQNSQLQIKTLADTADWAQSSVALNSGRAWSQARPPKAPQDKDIAAPRLTMQTPSATLSIRGTDWEVEVGPDGRTQLVVLSGEVEIVNDHGALKIGSGESAVAEIGKAPVRLILANPADRIQWVTAWQVQPRRWVPQPKPELAPVVALLEARDYSSAAQLLKKTPRSAERDILTADLAVMAGETESAIALLKPHAMDGQGSAPAIALLARTHLARGDTTSAAPLLAAARAAHPRHPEILLALAELNVFLGDVRSSREVLAATIEADAKNPEAWFLLGSIDTERENIRAARVSLDAALAARPDFPRAVAERGTLETLAGDLDSARSYYERALSQTPDNYVALTGRGILKLKSGDAQGGLEDFLRAGVIEPRFGRVWLYSAAAFYQLGEAQRAREALNKAMQLDPRDPLPYVLLGLIEADELSLGSAVDAAREAQNRMPYLKSLNQVLNNQKGSANVGSALASFGMEEWARYYATSAYSPWWAGSHLFLSDRYASGFNKNSELFTGFITDPTVFGASPRHSSLIQTPGHHGRVDLFLEKANWQQSALIGTANGFVAAPVPMAYFVSGDLSGGHSRLTADASDGVNLTVGLGMQPHHSVGVFLFGTDTRVRGDLNSATLPRDPFSIDDSRLDVGFNMKLDANNQFWLKAGSGHQSALVRGRVSLPPVVTLDRFLSRAKQDDMQFRHAFALSDGASLSWGYEDSRQEKPANFDVQAAPGVALTIWERTELRSRFGYVVARGLLAASLRGELGIFSQSSRNSQVAETRVNGALFGARTDNQQAFQEHNWRGGLQWTIGPQSVFTVAAQKWRRPASVATISPIDTLGIAVNDRLTTNGGLYRRNRVQIDSETGPMTFVQGFIDAETVRNVTSPLTAVVPDLQLTQLETLRTRRDAFTVQPELEQAPQLLEGKVRSSGFAVNHRTGRDHTVAVSYRRADAQQTGARNGLRIPYMSRDYLRLASHWSLPERWLIGTTATWRGERFRNEGNTAVQRIDPGWIVGLTTYWESADKKWIAQAILDNLRSNRNSSDDRASKLILRASYLF